MNRNCGAMICVGLLAALLLFSGMSESYAKPSVSMKFTMNREENLKEGKETLILPFTSFHQSQCHNPWCRSFGKRLWAGSTAGCRVGLGEFR